MQVELTVRTRISRHAPPVFSLTELSARGHRNLPRPSLSASTTVVLPGSLPEKRLGFGSTAGFSSWMRSASRSSNRQAWPTRRTSASRETGLGEAKMAASTRSIHSRQRAAGGRSKRSTSRGSSPSRRRRRAAALIGRRAGTWAARKIRARREQDETVEQPAGGAAGHWRVAGRLGCRDAILAKQQRRLWPPVWT